MSETELLIPQAESLVDELEDSGLLTRRQAEAYVLRRVIEVSRHEAADRLGVSLSRIDQAVRVATNKIEAARETISLIDRVGVSVDVEAITPDPELIADRLSIPKKSAEKIVELYSQAAEGTIRRALDQDDESLEICRETERGPVALMPLPRDYWTSLREIIDVESDAADLVSAIREGMDEVWMPCGEHDSEQFYRATVQASLFTNKESPADAV